MSEEVQIISHISKFKKETLMHLCHSLFLSDFLSKIFHPTQDRKSVV